MLIIFLFIFLTSKLYEAFDYRSAEVLVLFIFSVPAYYSVFRNYRASKIEKASNKKRNEMDGSGEPPTR